MTSSTGAEPKPFLGGFTSAVWFMVFNNAFGGMCVALVIKYADNIEKGFACALATVWAAVATVPLFGFTLQPTFLLGMGMVLVSTLLYGDQIKMSGQWWNSEPPMCTSVRGRDEEQGYAPVKMKDTEMARKP